MDHRIGGVGTELYRARPFQAGLVPRELCDRQLQAQAEMVLLLTDAIRPYIDDMADVPPYLFAMRLVQTLRWSAYDPAKMMFLPPEVLRELDEWEKALNLTSGKSLSGGSQQEGSDDMWTEMQRRFMSGRVTR